MLTLEKDLYLNAVDRMNNVIKQKDNLSRLNTTLHFVPFQK